MPIRNRCRRGLSKAARMRFYPKYSSDFLKFVGPFMRRVDATCHKHPIFRAADSIGHARRIRDLTNFTIIRAVLMAIVMRSYMPILLNNFDHPRYYTS